MSHGGNLSWSLLTFIIWICINDQVVSVFYWEFSKVSSDASLQILASYPNRRSTVQCALDCLKEGESDPPCEGFTFDDGGCTLYIRPIVEVSDNTLGINVYKLNRNIVSNGVNKPVATLDFIEILGPSPAKVKYYFYMSSEATSYADARDACAEGGGHLLHFNSLDEYDAVSSFLDSTGSRGLNVTWVGANDQAEDGKWVSEKDGDPLDSNWLFSPGEPNHFAHEDCAMMHFELMTLNDIRCPSLFHYICERGS